MFSKMNCQNCSRGSYSNKQSKLQGVQKSVFKNWQRKLLEIILLMLQSALSLRKPFTQSWLFFPLAISLSMSHCGSFGQPATLAWDVKQMPTALTICLFIGHIQGCQMPFSFGVKPHTIFHNKRSITHTP